MTPGEFDVQVARVAALGEPVRRLLYQYVVAQAGPVSREQAAAGVGIAHHTAKFHLDKLEAEGLLEVEYSRPPGRGGPGAGRPAKLYRRASVDVAVSLPARRYDLAGHVMAEAISRAARGTTPVGEALSAAAHTAGRALGEGARTPGKSPGGGNPAGSVAGVLAANGYEPRLTADGVVLANCPFHSLAEHYTALVCGMNLDLIDGLLQTLAPTGLCARLDPAPGRCCVVVTTEESSTGG